MQESVEPDDWARAHAGVGRLEDVLARLPFDRALPDLPTLLLLADVPASLVEHDDRARKVLHEAVLARPLSTPDAVAARRDEVEVLLLEVGLLADVLDGAGRRGDHTAETARAVRRLHDIRARLDGLRDGL